MTQRKALTEHLKSLGLVELDFKNITFDNQSAYLDERELFNIDPEIGGVIVYDLEGDIIGNYYLSEFIELFPNFEELTICQTCEGKGWYDNDPHDMHRIKCEDCENVEYK